MNTVAVGVGVAVAVTGVGVGVAVAVTGVGVGVAVAVTGVGVGVAVAVTGVDVGVAVGGTGVGVAVGGTGVSVGVGTPPVTTRSTRLLEPLLKATEETCWVPSRNIVAATPLTNKTIESPLMPPSFCGDEGSVSSPGTAKGGGLIP